MAKNNKSKGIQVRDVKAAEEKPKTREIQLIPGNTAILTVQLLNSINDQLIEIKELLKNV